MVLKKTREYLEWFSDQTAKTQFIVEARLERIVLDSHWGTHKRFAGLIELKWPSGVRIYLCQKDEIVWVLLGGNKNGQQKDIEKAKKLLQKV